MNNALNFGMVLYLSDQASNTAFRVNKHFKELNQTTSIFADRFNSNMTQMTLGVSTLVTSVMGLRQVYKTLEDAGKYEEIQIGVNTIAGSAIKGQKLLQDLKKSAFTSPFDFFDLAVEAKKLLAYSISAKDVVQDLRALQDISAGVGRERLPFLTLAFGQTISKSRLFLQEIKQFAESGVPLIEGIAKRRYGKTDDATLLGVREALEKKKLIIGAQEFREIIQDMTKEGGRFFQLSEKLSKSFAGRLSNLREQLFFIRVEFGEKLLPASKGLLITAQKIAASLAYFISTDTGEFFVKAATGLLVFTAALSSFIILRALASSSIFLLGMGFQNTTRQAIMSEIALGRFTKAYSIMAYSTKMGILGMTGSFLRLGGSLAGMWAFVQVLEQFTGITNLFKALPVLIGGLGELWQSYDPTFGSMSYSDDTGKALMAVNAFDTFQTLGKHMLFVKYTIDATINSLKQSLGLFISVFDYIDVINNKFFGDTHQGERRGFGLAQFIGTVIGIVLALKMFRVAMATLGSAIMTPFKLLGGMINLGAGLFAFFRGNAKGIEIFSKKFPVLHGFLKGTTNLFKGMGSSTVKIMQNMVKATTKYIMVLFRMILAQRTLNRAQALGAARMMITIGLMIMSIVLVTSLLDRFQKYRNVTRYNESIRERNQEKANAIRKTMGNNFIFPPRKDEKGNYPKVYMEEKVALHNKQVIERIDATERAFQYPELRPTININMDGNSMLKNWEAKKNKQLFKQGDVNE
jgi:hypothetical protein